MLRARLSCETRSRLRGVYRVEPRVVCSLVPQVLQSDCITSATEDLIAEKLDDCVEL